MKIVVAGGTGFLGAPLCWTWAEESHEVRVLTRSLPPGRAQHEPGTGKPGITRVGWDPAAAVASIASEVEGADAVVNLSGESIAGRRWNAARKRALGDSRIASTRALAAAIRGASTAPRVFISASAIGYYGDRGSEPLTEGSAPGDDFLARLCVDWEQEALTGARADVRTVLVRTGIVLERDGGALKPLVRAFRMGAGGRFGSGRQYMSWIHRRDWVEMVRWIVETSAVAGPVNATAPVPVTNAEFTRALGRALRRPALLPAPAFALRLALGEFADSVLASQRVLPSCAKAAGYHFRYPEIDIALRGIFEH
ncbi:MAG: TIGR01777 family oxidoreductase [Vicinamibacterales bacterium]